MSQAWPVVYGKPWEEYQKQLSRFETKVFIGETIFTSFPALLLN